MGTKTLVQEQLEATWMNIKDAVEAVTLQDNRSEALDFKRQQVQEAISLCDSLKSALVGRSAELGFQKRASQPNPPPQHVYRNKPSRPEVVNYRKPPTK